MKKQSGFTLVEILAAIAIVFILIAMTAGTYLFLRKKANLGGVADGIVSTLRLAQSRATASESSSQYGVYFDVSSVPQRYFLFKGASSGVRDVLQDRIFNLSSGTQFSQISLGGSNEIVFSKLAGSASNSGSIHLATQDGSATSVIFVDSFGQVNIDAVSAPFDDNRIKDSRHVHFIYTRQINVTSETLVLEFDGGAKIQNIPMVNYINGGNFDWEGTISVNGSNQQMRVHTHYLNNASNQTLFCVYRDRRYNDKSLVARLLSEGSYNLINYTAPGQETKGTSLYASGVERQ